MPVDLRALYPKLIHLMLDTLFVVDRDNQGAFVSDGRFLPVVTGHNLPKTAVHAGLSKIKLSTEYP